MADVPILKELVVILTATLSILFLCQKLGVPSIVGFLVAGVLIGPNGFQVIRDVQQVGVLANIGVILLLAAGASRTPTLLGIVAVLVVLGGVITPFMALPLRQSVQNWMAGGGTVPLRAWAAVALAIGAFIVYATMPRRRK